MTTFKASSHWPHYSEEPRFYDKDTGQFYELKDGKLVQVHNCLTLPDAGQASSSTETPDYSTHGDYA